MSEEPKHIAVLLRKVASALLGERDLHVPAHVEALEKGAVFFSSGHGAGYKVEMDSSAVTVKRVSRWAALAGFPPLYYFKGEFSHSGNDVALTGRVLMSNPAKGFILTWIGTVLIALVIGIGLAMYRSATFMTMRTASLDGDLSTAGFFVGAVMILAAFGAIVVGVLRTIKRKERDGLLLFCESFAQRGAAVHNL